MSMDTIRLQERFIAELLPGAPGEWDRIEVHCERFAWKEQVLEKYVSKALHGSQSQQVPLSLEALDTLTELQAFVPLGQAERWTWLEFHLDPAGNYQFDYRYGTPPLAANTP